MPVVEVCFSPALYQYIPLTGNRITIVIDILRATTSICTAFDNGVSKIIPLDSLETALDLKEKGNLVAAERDGLKPDFADFSNSAFDFMTERIKGKTIYYTTTNGTEAIRIAKEKGKVAIASFLNYPALVHWLRNRSEDIVMLCAGWKNNYCIEDTLCAGAMSESLLQFDQFQPAGDAVQSAVILWNSCNGNPEELIKKSSHFKRLEKLGYADVLKYSLESGRSSCIPALYNDCLIDLTANHNIYL